MCLQYKGHLELVWNEMGCILKFPDNYANKVAITLQSGVSAPVEVTHSFQVGFIWKSTSFHRMLIH